jgi:hypothetical protein
VLFTLNLLILCKSLGVRRWISSSSKPFLHQQEELWVMDILLGHVIQNVGSFIDRYVDIPCCPNLIDIRLYTPVNIQLIIVEK